MLRLYLARHGQTDWNRALRRTRGPITNWFGLDDALQVAICSVIDDEDLEPERIGPAIRVRALQQAIGQDRRRQTFTTKHETAVLGAGGLPVPMAPPMPGDGLERSQDEAGVRELVSRLSGRSREIMERVLDEDLLHADGRTSGLNQADRQAYRRALCQLRELAANSNFFFEFVTARAS